jgi:hypothetical protein
MSVESYSSKSYTPSQSEAVPALMLALLIVITGLELFLLATPHKVIAHPVRMVTAVGAPGHR